MEIKKYLREHPYVRRAIMVALTAGTVGTFTIGELVIGEIYKNRLFGKNGYADLNRNGIIEENEILDVLRRMGKSKVEYFRKTGRLPDVNVDDLESAVISYQAERK